MLVNYLFIADPRFNIQAVGYGTLLCYLVIAVWETAALCRYTSIRLDLVSVFLKPLAAAAVCAITAFLLHSRLASYFWIQSNITHVDFVREFVDRIYEVFDCNLSAF